MCTVGTCTFFFTSLSCQHKSRALRVLGARPHDMDAALSHRWGDGHVSARLCALAGGLPNATRVSVGSKPMQVHLQQNDLLWHHGCTPFLLPLPTFSAPRASCSALTCSPRLNMKCWYAKRVPDVVVVAFAVDIFVGVRRTPNLSSCQFPDRLPSRRQRHKQLL